MSTKLDFDPRQKISLSGPDLGACIEAIHRHGGRQSIKMLRGLLVALGEMSAVRTISRLQKSEEIYDLELDREQLNILIRALSRAKHPLAGLFRDLSDNFDPVPKLWELR